MKGNEIKLPTLLVQPNFVLRKLMFTSIITRPYIRRTSEGLN